MGKIIKTNGEIIDFSPKEKNGEFSLEELQSVVGGYIELVRCLDGKNFMIINEDGKGLKLPINHKATEIYSGNRLVDFIVGDVVLCNSIEAGMNFNNDNSEE
jgi:hypothetical protein